MQHAEDGIGRESKEERLKLEAGPESKKSPVDGKTTNSLITKNLKLVQWKEKTGGIKES